MSRGALMLRAARAGNELEYAPIAGATRRGSRAPGVSSRAPASDAAREAAPEPELEPEEPELVLLVGLPGAGKSTFFGQRFAATHVQLSRDELRRRREPERRQIELLRQALSERRSVVIDDTNVSREQRAPLIAEGQRQGARVVAYFFDCSVRECLARNRERAGRARIPEAGILASAKRLVPPSLDEGFDEIRVVRSLPEQGFEIC